MSIDPLYDRTTWPVRDDIDCAHRSWLAHVASAGTWWTGAQRVAFVGALWEAIDDPTDRPPWYRPEPPPGSPLPHAAYGAAHRLARHAATTSESWYSSTLAALGVSAPAFVELVALAALGSAVASFGPALGLPRPELPTALDGEPERIAPELFDAALNWVPVTGPPDERAAVVQAFSAVPAEMDQLWTLAAAQYLSIDDMAHLDWQRPGSLDRRQLELIAARLSIVRECFY